MRIRGAACIAAVAFAVCDSSASAEVRHGMRIDATALTSTAFFTEDTWYEGDEVETVELAAGQHFLHAGSGLVLACALVVTDAGTWSYAAECDGFLSGRGTDTLRLLGYTVTLDASPLSTPIAIANVNTGLFGASPRPVTLLPTLADYFVSPGPGVIADCRFGVALDGTVTYRDEDEGCLTGRGTRTLTFHGVNVKVDATALSTPSFVILQTNSMSRQPSDVVQQFRLLPTLSGYSYGGFTYSGIVWPSLGLVVGLDGRVDYPASADGWVSGRGTDTLVIRGYEVTIDARAAAPGVFAIPDAGTGYLDRATVHTLQLAPVSYLYFTGLASDFRFSVREQDGTIEVEPAAAACGSGSGPTLIVVNCQRLSIEDLTIREPAPGTTSRRVVRVRLSAPAPADVTVDWATSDGSATAPGDYTAASGTITFPAGTTARPINVTINGDDAPEPAEQFTVTLANAHNAMIERATATVTIENADPPDTRITAGPTSGSTVTGPPLFEFQAITPRPWYFECEALWEGAASTGFRRCASPHVVSPPPDARGRLLRFQVRAVDFDGIRDPSPDMRSLITYVAPRIDLSLAGIEVTQGVQERDCAVSRCEAGIMIPDYVQRAFGRNPAARYEGVTLSEVKQTFVRVYVKARGERAVASGVTVRLTGSDSNGRSLVSGGGGGILLPRYQPAAPPACCAGLTFADRANLLYAYTFPLPPDWSHHRTISLRAAVSPRTGITDTRPGDNWLDLTDIPFKRPNLIRLRPVAMSINGTWPGGYDAAFVGAQATFPNAFEIPPYQGVVDATPLIRTGNRKRQASIGVTLVDDWADDMDYTSAVFPFGVYRSGLGLDAGATKGGTALYHDRPAAFAESPDRSLTSAAHEVGHGLGLRHAGMLCGSHGDGQVGSEWPPDNEGRTWGFGLDTRGGMLRIWPDTDARPSWDLMSYCPPGDGDIDELHWLSPRNWTYLIDYFAPRFTLPARAALQSPARMLSVTAGVDASGAVSILSVRRITAAPTPSVPTSPWRIVVRDAAGRELSGTRVAPSALQDSGAQLLRAKLPAAGAASVHIVRAAAVVAERRRSAHAPRARILSPRRGAHVRGRETTVRWRATDEDRDPLTVTLDYSDDGGRTWRPLFIGADRGRVVLPTRLLTGSRNARLRLRANDGFSETAAISGRFVSAGAPPMVSISAPAKTSTIRADATLVAAGSAYDDGSRRITGRRLTWRLGRRVIGRGAQISTTDMPPGRHRLRLSARDRSGRVGSASVSVRVHPVTPRFIELTAPRTIKRTARRVRVRVLTNVTATLRIAGRRYRVSRHPRTISVWVTPGRRPLRLRATLAAGARRSVATLTVARRV